LRDEQQDPDLEICLRAARQHRLVHRFGVSSLEKDARQYRSNWQHRTGYDQILLKVDDAVELVVTAIRNIDRLQGSVVSREMKSALIRDILDLWIRERVVAGKRLKAGQASGRTNS